MKWLSLLLLLLNLAVFLWGFQTQKSEQKPQATIAAGVESLTLLSELEPQPKIVPKQKIDQPSEKVQVYQPTAAAVNDEGKEVLDKEEPDDLPKMIEVASVEVSTESEETPVVLEDPVPDVDEVDSQEEVDSQSEEPVEPESLTEESGLVEADVNQERICYQIGPIRSLDERDEIVARLSSIDLIAVQHEQEEQQVVGYWVLIPQQETRDQAIDMVKRLEQAGISDVRRFVKGELRNAISLGLFKNKSFADGRSQHIIRLGFETEIRPRIKHVVSYTLLVEVKEPAILEQDGWQALHDDYVGTGFTSTTCSSAAP